MEDEGRDTQSAGLHGLEAGTTDDAEGAPGTDRACNHSVRDCGCSDIQDDGALDEFQKWMDGLI